VQPIFRSATIDLGLLGRDVRIDRLLPHPEQHVSMRRHVNRVRHIGNVFGVLLRGGPGAFRQRTAIVRVDQVMRGGGMVLAKNRFEDFAGLALSRISSIQGIDGREH
jgi:hypothetical protein